jgi:hypothetical protein
VADFDFNAAEEEELQYKTFWERLRESFGTHLSNHLNIHKIHSKVCTEVTNLRIYQYFIITQ